MSVSSEVQEKSNQIPSTKLLLLGIWRQLSPRRRWQLRGLLLTMLVSGLAEVFSLAAVIPFLAVLSNPQTLWQVQWVQEIALYLGIREVSGLLFPATIFFGVAAVLTAAIRLANLWLNGRVAASIGSDLSLKAYKATLYQPYSAYLSSNSSDAITTICSQVNDTIRVINFALQLATASIVAFGLTVTLLVVDWQIASLTILAFGASYALLIILVRKKLALISVQVAGGVRDQLKSLQEGIGSIRDIILDGSQDMFLTSYSLVDAPLRIKQAQADFLGNFPRFIIETLAILIVAMIGFVVSREKSNEMTTITILGTIALGAQRMLPALQQIYNGWAVIRASKTAVARVLSLAERPVSGVALNSGNIIPFNYNTLEFRNVTFCYNGKDSPALRQINLKINRGDRIGIIGTTGSGKSTLVDLLMGLLDPSSGQMLVDGLDLHDSAHPERMIAWRSSIAHVPQSIYLADCSIIQNIAFSDSKDQINTELAHRSAKLAQIDSYIESTPRGYNTFVGERGVNLSGGQMQRIGIARALYKQSRILVLDEATSALDNSTEKNVMNAIKKFSMDITVVIIAHRLSTVSDCDRVIELSSGAIKDIVKPGGIGKFAE